MDSTIDRVLSFYVKINGTANYHDINKAIDFIYEKIYISVEDNITKQYIKERLTKILNYQKQLEELKKIPIIEQRSQEWYEARQGLISASDFGQALNRGEYGTQREFLIKKITGKSKEITYKAPLLWGVKFEEVATNIYSKRNRVKVFEFGLIKHPNLKYIGASPDGISELGIMLEIKCPYSRKISGKIMDQYYDQIQGQLEVCNLNECDFLECEFEQYKNEQEFLNDIDESECLTQNLKEKGIIVQYREDPDEEYKYLYSPLNMKTNEMVNWKNNIIEGFDITTEFKEDYWRLRKYNNQRVYRDVNVFEKMNEDLKFIWDKILYYRNPENKNEFISQIQNKNKAKMYDLIAKPPSPTFSGFAIKTTDKNENV